MHGRKDDDTVSTLTWCPHCQWVQWEEVANRGGAEFCEGRMVRVCLACAVSLLWRAGLRVKGGITDVQSITVR